MVNERMCVRWRKVGGNAYRIKASLLKKNSNLERNVGGFGSLRSIRGPLGEVLENFHLCQQMPRFARYLPVNFTLCYL
jgi:hypothetical protein